MREPNIKGVILAAGYGTRFLPGTKTIPKELFPLVDTPAIQLIVDEMIAAGIKEILVISSRRKKALEDYFDREAELEGTFAAEGAKAKLDAIAPPDVQVFFRRQQEMAGTGDALLLVEPFTGDSPFVVAYPDDVMMGGDSLCGQLVETWRKTQCTVLAGKEIPTGDISRFGVMDIETRGGTDYVTRMVEKPPPGTEPSRVVSYGRYLYTPEIFQALRDTRKQHTSGEFTQTEALQHLAGQGKVAVCRFEGEILDVGTPQGYLEAIIEYGLGQEKYREGLLAYLREVVKREG